MRNCQFTIVMTNNHWGDYDIIRAAARTLNGVAFKLFFYLSAFKDNSTIEFSPSDFCKYAQVSLTSEKNAFKELVLNKYLVEIEPLFYQFYPMAGLK